MVLSHIFLAVIDEVFIGPLFISGFARTDMSIVMKGIFSYGLITPERLAVGNRMFKMTLNPCDKRDWYPVIRPNSFSSKLPGTFIY